MNYTRNQERINVMNCLYQIFSFIENKKDYDATQIILDIYNLKDFESVPTFSKLIYVSTLDNIDQIISLIQPNLKNWLFSRLDNVAKAILSLAVGEGKFAKLNNKKIIINSYVNISKDFLKDGDYKFINAVLDKVL